MVIKSIYTEVSKPIVRAQGRSLDVIFMGKRVTKTAIFTIERLVWFCFVAPLAV